MIPGILAAIASNKRISKNIEGQRSSHLVYKRSSSCRQHLQHFDGQQPGHVQQQHKHVHKVRPRRNPITNGTM